MTSTGLRAVAAVSRHSPTAWADELVRVRVLAARLAGVQMSGPALERLFYNVGPGRASRHHRSVRSVMDLNGRWFHGRQECEYAAQSPERRGEAYVLTAGTCHSEADRVSQTG